MNKGSLTAILAIAIIIAFFLPYLSFMGESASGMNIVFGKSGFVGLTKTGSGLFVSLLVPLGGLFILIGKGTGDSFSTSGIVYWMPLLGVLYLLVMLYMRGNTGGSITVGEFVEFFGYGLWITIVAAVILPFTKTKS